MSSIKVIDNEKVEIIMRQTNYDKDLATKKLLEWDDNYMNVIREYMNPSFQNKKVEKKKSIQQNVISEIRNFMDNVSIDYEQRKEDKKKKEEKKEEEKKMSSQLLLSSDNAAANLTKNKEMTKIIMYTTLTKYNNTHGMCLSVELDEFDSFSVLVLKN